MEEYEFLHQFMEWAFSLNRQFIVQYHNPAHNTKLADGLFLSWIDLNSKI